MRFNIRFTFNRFPIRNMHRAAEYVSHNPEKKCLKKLILGNTISLKKFMYVVVPNLLTRLNILNFKKGLLGYQKFNRGWLNL